MNTNQFVQAAAQNAARNSEFFLAAWYADVKIKAVKRKKAENRGTIVKVKSRPGT